MLLVLHVYFRKTPTQLKTLFLPLCYQCFYIRTIIIFLQANILFWKNYSDNSARIDANDVARARITSLKSFLLKSAAYCIAFANASASELP